MQRAWIRHDLVHARLSRQIAAKRRLKQLSRTLKVQGTMVSSNGATSVAHDTEINPSVKSIPMAKTMALTDLAKSMKESGQDVIALAAGEPDFDTPEPVKEAAISAIREGDTHYTPNVGTSAVRKAIAHKLKEENNISYEIDEIVVSNGAKQCIFQAITGVVSPGDEVLIPAPYWTSYPSMAILAGAKPVVIETKLEDGYLLTPQDLEKNLSEKSRVLILCSPSNPTGAIYNQQRLQEIADIVRRHPRLIVISDEIYELIMYSPNQHHSFAAFEGMWDRTLTVNGFSKAFAMTGWRLGYIAGPKVYVKAIAKIQSQNTSGASSISQRAGVAALQLGKFGGKEVESMVQSFRERRDYIVQRLKKIGGLKVFNPQGAFYVFVDVTNFYGDSVEAKGFGKVQDADALCRYLLEKHLVALVPGDAFGDEKGLRISYAASLENLGKALDRLESAFRPDNFTR